MFAVAVTTSISMSSEWDILEYETYRVHRGSRVNASSKRQHQKHNSATGLSDSEWDQSVRFPGGFAASIDEVR